MLALRQVALKKKKMKLPINSKINRMELKRRMSKRDTRSKNPYSYLSMIIQSEQFLETSYQILTLQDLSTI